MIVYVTILIVFFYFIGMILFKKRRYDSSFNLVFKERVTLTKNHFFQTFYKDKIPEFIVIQTLSILDELLPFDTSKLYPDDSFTGNLNFLWKYTDEFTDIEIIERLENNFNIEISNEEAKNINSFDDIVKLVAKKLNHS
ncbi:acyl carrier protein [Leptospira noumeaensis]|uniref:Acyl carrier protein n=1 Tax=Leptospira noumeaensis TaxID=2484964 RepID=A0A4R9I5V8_9LEPT|nr:acyl carrier protein [Leptospira noumeaensis]TGK81343.1 acyl carrier protein [Leptospira noumeaensis]